MHGIAFSQDDDKHRKQTGLMEYSYLEPQASVDGLIDFILNNNYNTFFTSSRSTTQRFIKYPKRFCQGRQHDKKEYVLQSDCRSEYTHVLGLDVDRSAGINHTATDMDVVLQKLADEIDSPVVWMPSASESSMFKGRVFVPLVTKLPKDKLREFCYLFFAYHFGSGTCSMAPKQDCTSFLLGYTATRPKQRHEFLDDVGFSTNQKLNIYRSTRHKMRVYTATRVHRGDEGNRKVRFSSKKLNALILKYTTGDDKVVMKSFEDKVLYSDRVLAEYANKRFDDLKFGEMTKHQRRKLFRHIESGYLKPDTKFRLPCGRTLTLQELFDENISHGQLRLEPTDRIDEKYPFGFVRGGWMTRYDGGGRQRIRMLEPLGSGMVTEYTLDRNRNEYLGTHIPGLWDAISQYRVTILCAATGSGKTQLMANHPNTIMTVPSHAIKDSFGDGFMVMESDGSRLPESSDRTIIMTMYKLAGLMKNKSFNASNYVLVIDEAHTMFSSGFITEMDRGIGVLSSLFSESAEDSPFKRIVAMTANTSIMKQMAYYVEGLEYQYIKVAYTNLPTVSLALPYMHHYPIIKGKRNKRSVMRQSVPQYLKLAKSGRLAVYCDSLVASKDLAEHLAGTNLNVVRITAATKDDRSLIADCDVVIFTSFMSVGYSLPGEWGTIIVMTDKNKMNNPTGSAEAIQAFSRARRVKSIIVLHSGEGRKVHQPSFDEYVDGCAAFLGEGPDAYKEYTAQALSHLPGLEDLYNILGGLHHGVSAVTTPILKHCVIGTMTHKKALAELASPELFEEGLCDGGYKVERVALHGTYKKEKPATIVGDTSSLKDYVESLKGTSKEEEVHKILDRIHEVTADNISQAVSDEGKLAILTNPKLRRVFMAQHHIDVLRSVSIFKPMRVKEAVGFFKALYKTSPAIVARSICTTLSGSAHSTVKLRACVTILDKYGLTYSWVNVVGKPIKPVLGGQTRRTVVSWLDEDRKYKDGRFGAEAKAKKSGVSYPVGGRIQVSDPQSMLDDLMKDTHIEIGSTNEIE